MLARPAAILFDFDGVLVDTEWAIYDAWHELFRAHGHPLPLELYNRCIGSDFSNWSPKTHLEELTGNAFDWHQLDVVRQEQIESELGAAGPMPGVVRLLEHIQQAEMSSSSHRWVDGWLARLGLTERFATVVCRGDAARIKPAPDLFVEAARRLGVAPGDCLVIEDSLNGVRAARAAGMPVIAVPNRVTACLDFSLADATLPSLSEFPASLLGGG
jgi:HAD superfamily hydrolase (TIGR01509 family)